MGQLYCKKNMVLYTHAMWKYKGSLCKFWSKKWIKLYVNYWVSVINVFQCREGVLELQNVRRTVYIKNTPKVSSTEQTSNWPWDHRLLNSLLPICFLFYCPCKVTWVGDLCAWAVILGSDAFPFTLCRPNPAGKMRVLNFDLFSWMRHCLMEVCGQRG